ncbi:MAG: hypothetical protein DRP51_05165 [Candidatus Zixiibacteriota bacterium]|nr:MAG: hypothetical protein DRP51_05165 [candidate division Zixibacteria bacterium]
MPCGDITERLKLTVDDNNCLDSYIFSKKTCGGAIGMESLLLDYIGGKSIETIIKSNELTFLQTNLAKEDIETYLRLKHFSAIQSVLNIYVGKSSGGANDICAIAGIEYDGGNTIIDAEIKINLLADNIESCDSCGPN